MKIVITILFLVQLLSAQVVDTLHLSSDNQFVEIDSIAIEGNDITEEFIILREMTIVEGDRVNSKLIKYDRERIYSLGLFNYVDLHLIRVEDKNTLLIKVYEKWYLYPLPFIFFSQGELKNPTYGVNFKLENFRGRNETLSAFLAFGYDPRIRLSYLNPSFIYEEGIGFGAQIRYQDFLNRSSTAKAIAGKDFEYRIYSTSISFNKRLDQFNLVQVGTGFTYIESGEFAVKGITASGDRIDRLPFVSSQYVYDTRDLKQFPKTGLLTSAQLVHSGFGLKNISYQVLEFDFRQYNHLLNDLTARWRVNYRGAFGKLVPYYDYSFLGFSEYVRGHRDNEIEGLQYLLGSFEVSYAILDEWHLSLDLPLLPKNLTSARIGINFNIFADTGTTFDNIKDLKLNNFLSGYGFGLNILFLPFNSVRFEMAFDEFMNEEFIIGTGFSF